MKILFITSELPYPIHKSGISLINYRLLVKAPDGVEIDLICCDRSNEQDALQLKRDAPALKNIFFVKKTETQLSKLLTLVSVYLCGWVAIGNQYLCKIFTRLIEENKYSMVYACPLTMMSELTRIKKIPPIFLNAVDSYSMLCENFYKKEKNMTNKAKHILYRSYEKKMLGYASCVNFVSSVDAEYVRRFTKHPNIQNITLGIDDTSFFRNTVVKKEPNTLLFSGNYEYKPNADTAKYIVEQLFPSINIKYPNIKLYIVGKNPPSLKKNNNIIVTGFVEDITVWYNKAEIFICPLLYGAGIKNKILEAMACGIPVISSSIGVSGIEGLSNGTHFILADTREEQVNAIENLFSDVELREKIANNAIQFIKKKYNWGGSISTYYVEFKKIKK